MKGGYQVGQIDVEEIKKKYPEGTKIELLEDMVQEEGMPKGLRGTVDYIDDAASLHCKWSNGRSLAVLPGIDKFRKVE